MRKIPDGITPKSRTYSFENHLAYANAMADAFGSGHLHVITAAVEVHDSMEFARCIAKSFTHPDDPTIEQVLAVYDRVLAAEIIDSSAE